MYPESLWYDFVGGQLQTLPEFQKDAQKLRRFLAGLAYPCEMDGQGRVLLPEKLRKLTGLDKKAVLVGQMRRFEIWNEAAWEAQESEFMSVSDGETPEFLKRYFILISLFRTQPGAAQTGLIGGNAGATGNQA